MHYEIAEHLLLPPSNEAEVLANIRKLESAASSRYDGISARFLKRHANKLAVPISRAINRCFDSGTYPSVLKTAAVTPIYKSGDKGICSNYRPLSVLPALNMLVEEELKVWLLSFLDANGIIHKHQFGFIKKSSTLAATPI